MAVIVYSHERNSRKNRIAIPAPRAIRVITSSFITGDEAN